MLKGSAENEIVWNPLVNGSVGRIIALAQQEALLGHRDGTGVVVAGHVDERVAHLEGPRVHDGFDWGR